MNIIDWLTSIDENTAETVKLLRELLKKEYVVKYEPVIELPADVVYRAIRDAFTDVSLTEMVKRGVEDATLDNRYAVFKLDLSVERENEPLIKGKFVARSLTVLRADSVFYMKLNGVDADTITGKEGVRLVNMEIRELYITNSSATGNAEILVSWRE